jgi:hypothetical protein
MCFINLQCCLFIVILTLSVILTLLVTVNMSKPTPLSTRITTGLLENHLKLSVAIANKLNTEVVIYTSQQLEGLVTQTVVLPRYNDIDNYTVNYRRPPKYGSSIAQREYVEKFVYFPSSSINYGIDEPNRYTNTQKFDAYLNLIKLVKLDPLYDVKRIEDFLILFKIPVQKEPLVSEPSITARLQRMALSDEIRKLYTN